MSEKHSLLNDDSILIDERYKEVWASALHRLGAMGKAVMLIQAEIGTPDDPLVLPDAESNSRVLALKRIWNLVVEQLPIEAEMWNIPEETSITERGS